MIRVKIWRVRYDRSAFGGGDGELWGGGKGRRKGHFQRADRLLSWKWRKRRGRPLEISPDGNRSSYYYVACSFNGKKRNDTNGVVRQNLYRPEIDGWARLLTSWSTKMTGTSCPKWRTLFATRNFSGRRWLFVYTRDNIWNRRTAVHGCSA